MARVIDDPRKRRRSLLRRENLGQSFRHAVIDLESKLSLIEQGGQDFDGLTLYFKAQRAWSKFRLGNSSNEPGFQVDSHNYDDLRNVLLKAEKIVSNRDSESSYLGKVINIKEELEDLRRRSQIRRKNFAFTPWSL